MNLYEEIFFYSGFIWGIASFMLLAAAWRAAARKRIRVHRALMVLLVSGAWGFVLLYLMRYNLPGVEPLKVPTYLVPWLAVHGTIALTTVIGVTLLVWARLTGSDKNGVRSHLNCFHRIYGRVLAILWVFTHAGGLINFLLFG